MGMITKTHAHPGGLATQRFGKADHKPFPPPSCRTRMRRGPANGIHRHRDDLTPGVDHFDFDMRTGMSVAGQDSRQEAGNKKASVMGVRPRGERSPGFPGSCRQGGKGGHQAHQPGQGRPPATLHRRSLRRRKIHKMISNQKRFTKCGQGIPRNAKNDADFHPRPADSSARSRRSGNSGRNKKSGRKTLPSRFLPRYQHRKTVWCLHPKSPAGRRNGREKMPAKNAAMVMRRPGRTRGILRMPATFPRGHLRLRRIVSHPIRSNPLQKQPGHSREAGEMSPERLAGQGTPRDPPCQAGRTIGSAGLRREAPAAAWARPFKNPCRAPGRVCRCHFFIAEPLC